MYEDEECSGITHFLEHVMIRNVNHIFDGKLYSMLDRYGLEFNASTFSEMVQFYVSGADVHFERGADMITKLLMPLSLPRSEIDAERRRVKAEIRESDDKSSLSSFTSKEVFSGTSLANSIVGTGRTLDRMSGKRLEEYRYSIFSSKNIFFYVTGSFSEADIASLCKMIDSYKLSCKTENRNIAPVPRGFFNRLGTVHVKNSDYTMVRFTFDIDMSRATVAETDLLYDLLLSGYNSKLFIEMSEKRGMLYDINGASERYRNIGTLSFYFEVKAKELAEAISLAVDILNSVKDEKNIDCIKAGYVDNAYLLYDDIRELNFTFAYDNHIMGQGYNSIEDRKARYENVSAARLAELAREIFLPRNLTLTVKGDKKKIDTEHIKAITGRLK